MKPWLPALALVLSLAASADTAPRWYTFSWPVTGEGGPSPRGGTTTGVPVTAAPEPDDAWVALQGSGLDTKERDRRAILALAGDFRTGFDFVETLTYLPGLDRAQPYQSWATEFVFVLEDRPDFIALQHIMVMSYLQDGAVRGPFVQKHWRQDWQYESDRTLEFHGERRWSVRPTAPEPGTWTQTVFQVDDTPRYAATGRWTHRGNHATWTSQRAWRPLPRRESSTRDDYQALASEHRISITPGGWVHEQDSLKAVVSNGELDATTPYVARELGVARYTRIVDYDFQPGRDYWRATADYWAEVRRWWRQHLAEQGIFELRGRVDGQPLFVPMFEYAAALLERDDEPFDRDAARAFIRDTLERYVTLTEAGKP